MDADLRIVDMSNQPCNDRGAWLVFSSVTGLHYCGAHVGRAALPGSDGRCGPRDGPACHSCVRFQTVFDADPAAREIAALRVALEGEQRARREDGEGVTRQTEVLLHGHRQDLAALRADLEGEQRSRRESETGLAVLIETHRGFVSRLRSDMRESEAEVARLRMELHNRPVQLHPEVARITRVWEERFAECQDAGRAAREERDRYFQALEAEQRDLSVVLVEAREERARHFQAITVL
jgi:hypothetical protein